MIPTVNIILMALNGILGFAVPIGLSIWLIKKYHCRIETILIGAGVFFLFALVLETIVHQIVLPRTNIMGNTLAYATYGGLMAGLFEESGRFIAMKFLLKKDRQHTALAYGAGHGGIEMIMIFGISMLTYAFLAVMANLGKMDMILATAPAEAKDQMDSLLATFQSNTPVDYLMGLWERFSALVLQLSLSVLVLVAVRCKGRWWLFPIAILLHALVDGLTVMLVGNVSMPVLELIVMCMAIAIAAMAWLTAKRNEC